MEEVNSGSYPENYKTQNSVKKDHIPYHPEPDYTKPAFKIPPQVREDLFIRLRLLYGEAEAKQWMPELERILKVHHAHKPQEMIEADKTFDPKERFTEKDMILITYGDLIRGEEYSPLATLYKFVPAHPSLLSLFL
jgi:sucrose phosphorylase